MIIHRDRKQVSGYQQKAEGRMGVIAHEHKAFGHGKVLVTDSRMARCMSSLKIYVVFFNCGLKIVHFKFIVMYILNCTFKNG